MAFSACHESEVKKKTYALSARLAAKTYKRTKTCDRFLKETSMFRRLDLTQYYVFGFKYSEEIDFIFFGEKPIKKIFDFN